MPESWDEYLDLQAEDMPSELAATAPEEEKPPEPPSFTSLAHDLYLPEDYLVKVDSLLRDRGQIVFTGPPGSGKTFIARRLAEHYCIGNPARMEFIQFHPSYSYEDFVEGYRPRLIDEINVLSYSVEPGPLLQIVRAAELATEEYGDDAPPYVLVIDELNRANLGKVFGELFFALEYRDIPVRLQYSPDKPPMRLPRNLLIIGTMNTADRSIAVFDAALRRRFFFLEFSPLNAPFDGVLSAFLTRLSAEGGPDLLWIDILVRNVNQMLPDPRYAIGPSYFMRDDLSESKARDAWEFTVVPYLADRFEHMSDEGVFDWDSLRESAQLELNEALAASTQPLPGPHQDAEQIVDTQPLDVPGQEVDPPEEAAPG